MNKRKLILAIADGIGDRPIASLSNKTPLEYAQTPTLDKLAANGITGMMDLISPGIPIGTDMGHLILFGYHPSDYPGRGPIEAAGIGLQLQPGDVVCRCNMATVDDEGIVVDRRAGRIREGLAELIAAVDGMVLEDQVVAKLLPATEHRAVLVLRGANLSDRISDSDPHAPNDGKPYHPVEALDSTEAAARTARYMNEFLRRSHEILKQHPLNLARIEQGLLPANFVLTRGAGCMKEMKPITEQFNFSGCCVASEKTVLGVAKLAGFETCTDERMTGNIDTDIELKAKSALEQLNTHDVVYVHLKAPDIKGHDNLPLEKVESIEKFDKMVGYILERLPEDTYLALAADHSTPCEVGEHTGEPVPVLIYGPSIRRDRNELYNEMDCAYGGLGRISGNGMFMTMLDLLNLSHKQGN